MSISRPDPGLAGAVQPIAPARGSAAAVLDPAVGSVSPEVLRWLLAGDPSIRWQVLKDLLGAPQDDVIAARRRVATSGWGARLLAAQDPDGRWAGGLYSPKWTSTTYTLLLLLRLGLPRAHPAALAGCRQLWAGVRSFDGGLNLARGAQAPETCITAMLVALAYSFGYTDQAREGAVDWLLQQQLADGGWNCASLRTGSQHGSFHTSASVVEALLAYRDSGGGRDVSEPLRRGLRFYLDHRLFRSHRTGAEVNLAFTKFPFPPQWHFDVLRGLELFRASGASRDERLTDGVEVVLRARRKNGTWPVHSAHPGRVWFRMESAGPSRWATLRALRVLRWWWE